MGQPMDTTQSQEVGALANPIIRFQPNRLDQLQKQIEQATAKLYKLENGWGGDGDTIRPDDETILDAEYLCKKIIIHTHKETNKDIPIPHFSPDADGGVGLNWKHPFSLSITIYPNGDKPFYGEGNKIIHSKTSNINDLYLWIASQVNDTRTHT
jgi:hypothetical protein